MRQAWRCDICGRRVSYEEGELVRFEDWPTILVRLYRAQARGEPVDTRPRTGRSRMSAKPQLSGMETLAPGVLGYTVDMDDALYVPFIAAANPGAGDVGRYLDSLPSDKTVKVPGVISAQLRGMLDRRGFKSEREWAEEFDEWVEVMVRR